MAGWKLRKDKIPAETPDAETSDAKPEIAGAEPDIPLAQYHAPSEPEQRNPPEENNEPVFLDSVPHLPAFDAEPEVHFEPEAHFTDLDFDSDFEESKAEQTGHGDGPLTLVDYTEPEGDDTKPDAAPAPLEFSMHGAQIFEMPPPVIEALPPVIEMPPPVIEALPPTEEDSFPERLRTGRFEAGELAPAPEFGFGIPTVSPFVLDTPPSAAPPAAPPQLVVHVGRLSAPFALAKDVTTVGRPDSGLHYYPDVEIELDDAVSRRHAEVVKRGDSYYLVDTGSTNGTLLNGERLPAQEERLLAYGDRIRIGDRTEIMFE